MSRTGAALIILIFVALALSLSIGVARVEVERAARCVAVVLDGDDARALAVESGRSLEVTLRKFRQAGVTAVAACDETLPRLVQSGRVTVVPAQWAAGVEEPAQSQAGIAIVTEDRALGEALAQRLSARFPPAVLDLPQSAPGAAGYRQIIFRGDSGLLDHMGLWLAADVAAAGRSAGLDIAARTFNYPGITDLAIRHAVGDAAEQQAGTIIFGEKQVMGYPDLLPNLARALEWGGLVYGSVEFARQMGDAELGRLLGGAVVRVHSITEKELPNLTPRQAAQRFVRAAMERNARVCYMRALGGGRGDRLSANVHYAAEIARSLTQRGFALGRPSLFAAVGAPLWARLAIGVGIAAAAVLLAGLVLPLGEREQWILLAAGVAVAAVLALAGGMLGRKALALVGALLFPTLALVALARWLDSKSPGETPAHIRWPALAIIGIGALLFVSAVSLAGGLLVAALLTDRLFLVKVEQFSGVKVAMALPLAVLAGVLAGGAYARGEGWRDYARRVGDNFRRFFGQPVAVWQAVLAVVVLGAGLLLIMRTGNEPASGVSQLEMKFRALLENWLVARPRSKEFLFGHPALILAAAAALRGRRRWAAVLLLAGAVGQVSLVNTFCHLHSPLLLSLQRTAHSLWMGAVLAGVAILVWWLAARRWPGRAS